MQDRDEAIAMRTGSNAWLLVESPDREAEPTSERLLHLTAARRRRERDNVAQKPVRAGERRSRPRSVEL
jgi:hypothetical protein